MANMQRDTVTLIRGRTYIYKDYQFFVNEPREDIPREVCQELENIADPVTDSEGERREKPRFKVVYAATTKAPKIGTLAVKKVGGKPDPRANDLSGAPKILRKVAK